MVLLPGFVSSSARVAPLAEALADRRPVFALDYPGVRCSDPLIDGPLVTMAEHGRHVASAVEALGAPVDLVGNSFGCQVAMEVALIRPDLVERMVLTSPVLEPAARRLPTLFMRWQRELLTESWRYRWVMVKDFVRSSPTHAFGQLRASRRDSVEDKAFFITAPTLVLYGSTDPITSPEWAGRIASALTHGELQVLDGATHCMVFDNAERTAKAIEQHLSRHPATSPDSRPEDVSHEYS
jgi:2-hydroxy-6-oxonona-2,4-dienedioate hydrolase